MAKRFRVVLEKAEDSSACGIRMPFDVVKVFGTRGRVPVRGAINGYPFRSTLSPMGGCHMMPVNRALRDGAGVAAGETISVVLERDDEPRTVAVPADLAAALAADPAARTHFDGLAYSHRRRHVMAIDDAKTPETRARRIDKAVAMLHEGGTDTNVGNRH